MSEQTLDVSWKTIARVFLAGIIFYAVFLARNVLIWFFFALIISILLKPAVNFLRALRAPKILAVTLVYLSLCFVIGLVVYLSAPIFIFEINQFAKNIPDYFEKINPALKSLGIESAKSFTEFAGQLTDALNASAGGIIKAFSIFFGGVSSALFIFTLAFFISFEEKGVENFVALLTPKRYGEYVTSLFEKVEYRVAGWFGARILSCIFVGLASFLVFFLLGVKFSFILGLVSGLLNFVPYIGPAITLIFSVLFALVSGSPSLALYVLLALFAIQEIENNLLTPVLMKKFMDMPPVLVLMSLLVGGVLFGFLGTIFSVPVFGIVYELSKEFLQKRREEHYGD